MPITLKSLPFFVQLMGIGTLAMLVPSVHALVVEDFVTMRVFFYGTILFGFLTLVLALATAGYQPANLARSQLMTLLAAFAGLPLMFALPFYEAVGDTTFLHAWFEMVSSFTTTGATIYDGIGDLTLSQHLWRATVGWMGGLLVWITALAIFAPMNLGGFEVRALGGVGSGANLSDGQGGRTRHPADRLARAARQLVPFYTTLTGLLWLGLVILGELPAIALIHAMSVLSTSGISAIGGIYYAVAGFWGEVLIFGFFAFAISQLTFSPRSTIDQRRNIIHDAEVQVAATLVAGSVLLLYGRHFVGAQSEIQEIAAPTGLQALWGTLFTVTSFLTTTGFESRFWDGATDWSGLKTPGLFLVGMALIGGGVATTAGGVKLLRVYALYRHSRRELERLLHPSSLGRGGEEARRIRKQGAFVSWIFFMLFAISVAGCMTLLSLTGVQFETAMVLTVASLSTTGPLAEIAGETPIAYSGIPDLAKFILAAAMVLGRLETLALIALFSPELWRK